MEMDLGWVKAYSFSVLCWRVASGGGVTVDPGLAIATHSEKRSVSKLSRYTECALPRVTMP